MEAARLADRLGVFGLRLGERLAGLFPLPVGCALGGLIGRLVISRVPAYRRLVERNLAIAFAGEMDPAARRRLRREVGARLGANLVASFRFARMEVAEIMPHVEINGRELLDDLAVGDRGGLFLLFHLGPWEVLTRLGTRLFPGRRFGAVYQELTNPLADAHVRETRARAGCELFGRKEGFAEVVKLLRGGGCAGILCDQHAGDAGVYVPFFDRLASTTHLPLLLARRADVPVYSLAIETIGKARWRVTVERVPLPGGPGDRRSLLVVNQVAEKVVRQSAADWFWVHNRWKTPQPAFLLTGHKRGWVLPPGPGRLKPFRVVVRSPNWLGDACMALSAVQAMVGGRPDLSLMVLSPAKLADFWRAVPGVDEVIPIGEKDGPFKVGRRLRDAGPIDVGLLFPNSMRTALEMRAGGVYRVVGYATQGRGRLLHQVVPEKQRQGPPGHHIEHYLQLAHRAGADCRRREIFDPLGPSASADGRARIGICAGAEYGPAKRWPASSFAAMANTVDERAGDGSRPCWVLFGTAGESALGAALEAAMEGEVENLVGRTSLAGLMDELRRCHLLVSNDTGTMHLAAVLGVPVVAIFGSTEPAWTRPPGRQHVILREHVECSPCFLRECPLDLRCMAAITPERVADEVVRLVGGR